MKPKLLATFILLFFSSLSLFGQNASEDFFRSTGKIYTVLAVVLLLFGVILFFLLRLESKISKLEKRLKNE